MCNNSCISFGRKTLSRDLVKGRSVIEVGSYNVNGSLRSFVEGFEPSEYLGVDIELGPGVDQICKAEDLVATFGKNRFDVVISTEMVEHVKNWQKVIHNLKELTRPGGILLVTTRSEGFPQHGYPFDFWRYELADMELIFSDFEIQNLDDDSEDPGVLILARKPQAFKEQDLRSHQLFSIIRGKRISTNSIYVYLLIQKSKALFERPCVALTRVLSRFAYYAQHPFGLPAMVARKLRRSGSRHNTEN